ncbi:MAG: transglycosylase domain-containing protein, partial [Caldisericia bacterium]|nr:transglycosylase domain-containing protein [Caldisericia bacterium]
MRKRRIHPVLKVFLIILTIILVLLIGAGIYVYRIYLTYATSLPSIKDIQYEPPESSEIFDRNGNLIKTVFFVENRIYVPLSEVPKNFIDALIASEDARFFEHHGVDFKGIIRAAINNIRAGKIVEGGSTITQQLVRELFLSKEVSLDRKIKEAILALRLEKIYSKEEILEY